MIKQEQRRNKGEDKESSRVERSLLLPPPASVDAHFCLSQMLSDATKSFIVAPSPTLLLVMPVGIQKRIPKLTSGPFPT